MRIISWNCNMAFRNKKEQVLKFNPDILVIQECEDPSKKGNWKEFSNYIWIGDNKNKGIAIFSRNNFGVEITDNLRIDYSRFVIPVKIKGEKEYRLFAVWAMNDSNDRRKRYIGQVFTAVNFYRELITKKTIIAGDFNWNSIWDKSPDSPLYGTLEDTTSLLKERGLISVYHNLKNNKFGQESSATFYMHRKKDKPYHIDYIFIHEEELQHINSFNVGDYEEWIGFSDHMPIFLELNQNN